MAALLSLPFAASAATWVGNTSANWNTAANWGGTLPTPGGDALSFGTAGTSGTVLNNDISGQTINSLTINAGAPAWTMGGNSVTLAGDVINSSSNLLTLNFPIATTAVRTFTTSGGGGNVLVGGVVSGASGGVIADGAGTLTMTATNSYTGQTTINSGSTLQLGNGGGGGNASSSSGVVNSGALIFNRSGNPLFSPVISGTGAVNVIGPGTVVLSAANSYTGQTTINSGSSLQLGTGAGGGAAGNITSSSGVVNNGTLIFNRSSVGVAFTPIISGVGAVSFTGTGSIIFSTAQTYTGQTTINAGSTLQLGTGGTAGSILSTSGVTDNGALVFNRSGNPTSIGFVISGTGAVSLTGTGTITLAAANTYSGVTTISTGTLQLGFGTGGGTVGSINNTSSITNNATLTFNRSNALNVATSISGSGNVNQIGGGVTTLSGINQYSGGTSVNAGVLTFLNTNAKPGTGTVSVLAGTTLGLGVATSGTYFSSNDVDSLFAGTLSNITNSASSQVGIDTTAGDFTYTTSVASNTRGLNKLGVNALTLLGSNAYTGTTTVTGGVLRLENASAVPGGVANSGGTSALLFNGGVIGLSPSTGDFTRSLGTTTPAATEAAWASGATGGFAAFGGNRSVNFGGASTPTLVTWSSITGSLGAGLILSDNSADSTVTVVNPIALNSGTRTVIVNDGGPAVDGVLSGTLSGTASSLIKSGGGTLALTGTNTFGSAVLSGTTFVTINSGTLQIGSGGTTGSLTSSGSGDIQNDATLAFNRSDALAIQYVIKGTGAVSQVGAGATSLSGVNTYSGGTNVNVGALSFLNTNARPANGITTVASGATLGLGVGSAGSLFTSSDVDNLFSGTLGNVTNNPLSLVGIDTSAGSFTYSSNVPSTTRGLNKLGANVLTVSGSNAYSGATILSGGVLRLENAAALPGGVGASGGTSALLFNGGVIGLTVATGDFTRGILGLTPGAQQVGWANGVAGGFAAFGGSRTVNFGGANAPVTWSSSGGVLGSTLILSDSSSDSTITISNPIALSNINSSRTVLVNDGSPLVDAILSGVISSTTTRLIKSGTGTLALTAANTYGIALGPGVVGTTVSAGVLQIGNGGTLGSIGAGSDINNNATLAFNRSDAFTLANNITGTGAVRQIGGGTTTLSGISTYTGPTTVAAGTLEISGSINGSNSVSVTNGALTLSNSNAVNDNAALILGNATLTVGGTSEFVGNNSASATAAGVGSLTVTSSSTIDFVAGSSTLWFSSLTSVIGTLSITNWSGNSSLGGGADQLRFTTDPGAFLGQISFAGAPAAGQIFFANGGNPYFEVVPIPEPSSTALMALATLCAFGSFRRVSRSRAACSEVISEQVPILWEAEL